MNNQFLQHLKSITPQGKAEEKKIFIPASEFKDKKADRVEVQSDEEQLDEATRSKYLKIYGTHKVGTDTSALELARKKHDAAIMRRGGASPEAVKRGLANEYGIDHEVDMAKYRFANKRAKHLDKAIANYNRKASKSTNEAVSTKRLFPVTEGVQRMRRLRSARFGQQGVNKELDAAYDKELSKLSASRLRRGGAPKQTVRGFFTDKPTTKAADKAYSKFSKGAMEKANAKGKKIFEAKTPKPLKKLKRKLVKTKNRLRNLGQAAFDIMGKPQDNIDYTITGRKF